MEPDELPVFVVYRSDDEVIVTTREFENKAFRQYFTIGGRDPARYTRSTSTHLVVGGIDNQASAAGRVFYEQAHKVVVDQVTEHKPGLMFPRCIPGALVQVDAPVLLRSEPDIYVHDDADRTSVLKSVNVALFLGKVPGDSRWSMVIFDSTIWYVYDLDWFIKRQ